MKKNNKKRIAVLAFTAILTSILATNVHTTKEAKTTKTDNGLAIVDMEALFQDKDFMDSYEKSLEENFGENYKEIVEKNRESVDTAKKIDGLFMKARSGKAIYPDYYGGMYIDDNEDLVVQIVEDKIPQKSSAEYAKYLEIFNNSRIEYVKTSYTELENILDRINEYIESNVEVRNYFRTAYIDLDLNSVVVGLKNNNIDERSAIINLVGDSNLIVFTKSEGSEPTVTLSPGSAVKSCTMGFRARYNGHSGLITAGHCVMDKNENGNYETVPNIGPVEIKLLGGSVDVAFIEGSDSNLSLTNTLKYSLYPATSLSTTFVSSFVVNGQIIGKVGAKTLAQSGKITQSNITIYDEDHDVTLTNMVEASAKNEKGDSGGPVFTMNKASADILGIVSQKPKGGTGTIYTKLDNIRAKINITRY